MTRPDIAWYFATVRWLPLFLFTGMGIIDLMAQASRNEPPHWAFIAICITFGLLLFRVGCLLMACQPLRNVNTVSKSRVLQVHP